MGKKQQESPFAYNQSRKLGAHFLANTNMINMINLPKAHLNPPKIFFRASKHVPTTQKIFSDIRGMGVVVFPSLGIKNRQISSKPKTQGTEGQETRGKHLGHRALVPAPFTKNGIFLAEDVI